LKFRQFAIRPQHVLARGRDGRLHGKQRFHRRRPLQNGERSKHKWVVIVWLCLSCK
jgi:hypothetical protein